MNYKKVLKSVFLIASFLLGFFWYSRVFVKPEIILGISSVAAIDSSPSPFAGRVLILVNDAMPAEAGTGGVGASVYVGEHYAAARNIPSENILHITTATSEYISNANYMSQIEGPVRSFLDANSGRMKSQILYIVPTYGVPVSTQTPSGQTLSVDGCLITMYSKDGGSSCTSNYGPQNFYYNVGAMGKRPARFNIWSDENQAKGGVKQFIVTRLDGPSALISKREVDDAILAESTLTRSSGTSYFDIRDIYGDNVDGSSYSSADTGVLMSANLTAASGFSTHYNHQLVTDRMLSPGSVYQYRGPGSPTDAFILSSSSMYVQSVIKNTLTSSFATPAVSSGEFSVNLNSSVWGATAYVAITLTASDPSKYIRLTYPYTGTFTPVDAVLEKNGASSVSRTFTTATDAVRKNTEVKIIFSPSEVRAFYGDTLFATLLDPAGTPEEYNNVLLTFYNFSGNVDDITLLDASGTTVYSDDFSTDTTANYTWETRPKEGPNALFVYGWYSANGSHDTYSFIPGSIGAQFTSYTAGRIRSLYPNFPTFDPGRWYGNWVGRMLEAGVTATFGTVTEPYVVGYTKMHRLLDHFFVGYNFGESYMMADPMPKWTMVAIGDPLYAPNVFANGYLDTTPPVAPFGLSSTSDTSSITLSWSPGTDDTQVTGYYIYRNGALIGGASASPFTDTVGINKWNPYSYQVATVDRGLNISKKSSAITANMSMAATPVIRGISAEALAETSAVISWTTDTLANSQVEYGETASYGMSSKVEDASFAVTSHTVTLSSLSPNTSYHYRVKSKDTRGNPNVSPDYTFTTSAAPPPVLTGISAETSAVISWTTDTLSDSQVEYGTTTSYGLVSALEDVSAPTTSHTITLHSLSPNTQYYYRVKSRDAQGNEAISSSGSFTTYASGNPILFDVGSQPGGSKQRNTNLFIILFVIPGALGLMFMLFILHKKKYL